MKYSFSATISLVFIYLAVVASSVNAQTQTTVVAQSTPSCYSIPNASFEQFADNKPLNWSTSSWGGAQARYNPVKPGYNSVHTGRIAMYAFIPGTDAKLRSDAFTVQADSQINVGLFARGNAGAAELQVIQLDSSKRVLAYTWLDSLKLNSVETSWSNNVNSFYATAETAYIQLEILVKSTGSVFIDELWAGHASMPEGQCGQTDSSNVSDANSNQPQADVPSTTSFDKSEGYIFKRNDTTEFRWIEQLPSGDYASIWIPEDCAAGLNSPVVQGDWFDLISQAPLHDAAQNPCGASSSSADNGISLTEEGFVFSRTDTREYRWIDVTPSGQYGNQWISEACANRLGGAALAGDWHALNDLAPLFDSVNSPC